MTFQEPWGRKRVRCIDTGTEFESVKDAARAIGAAPQTVSAVLRGRQLTAKGYRFELI